MCVLVPCALAGRTIAPLQEPYKALSCFLALVPHTTASDGLIHLRAYTHMFGHPEFDSSYVRLLMLPGTFGSLSPTICNQCGVNNHKHS